MFRRILAKLWFGSTGTIRRNIGLMLVILILFLITFYREYLFQNRHAGKPGLLSNLPSIFSKGFVVDGPQFMLNGEKIRIISGAMHYFRVPPEYWRDRLKKIKACGLNTVETYVPWNLHEEYPGNFSFNGFLDIEKFLSLAQEEGLYVIFRPGPYICAEWDLGGLPAWLLRDPEMMLRTTYKGYLNAVESYFKVLIPKILPYQLSRGGPILMMQIENEYGSYRVDQKYLYWLRDLLKALGVTQPLFTSDGFDDGRLPNGSVYGELAVVNDRDSVGEALEMLKKFQPNRPLMLGEFWAGWFDHWKEKRHHVTNINSFVSSLSAIFQKGASLNLYMFHGGTNFNFWNGANMLYKKMKPPGQYKPTITSYDYDAPISESGELTKKYFLTCNAIEKLAGTGYKMDQSLLNSLKRNIPSPVEYGSFSVKSVLPLSSALRFVTPWTIKTLAPMEQICDSLTHESSAKSCVGQNFGFVAYRTQVPASVVNLHIEIKLADRALIIIDNKVMDAPESFKEDQEIKLDYELSREKSNDLIILVENMGRVNYVFYPFRAFDQQRKGILSGAVKLEDKDVEQWQVYMLSMKPDFIQAISNDKEKWKEMSDNITIKEPAFYRAPLEGLAKKFEGKDAQGNLPADTFLNFETWTKGAAFINGFNLGRYWNVGPQKTLYVPGPRLKDYAYLEGDTKVPELIMFELHAGQNLVKFQDKPILGVK